MTAGQSIRVNVKRKSAAAARLVTLIALAVSPRGADSHPRNSAQPRERERGLTEL